MPTPSELLAERIDRIENVPDRFIGKVGASQKELYNELIVILSKLGLDEGVQMNRATLVRIDSLVNEYYDYLKTGKYGQMVSGFISELDKQKIVSDDYNRLEFGLTATIPSADVIFQQHKTRAVEVLLGDDFKTNFINKIKDDIVSSVEGRATFKELRTNLLSLFTEEERLPIMQSYVSQVSGDVFSFADRAYNNEVARDLGLQFGRYSGGLIKDSRKFCVDRDNRFFHINEVMDWAYLEWQGKYRRTTRQNMVQVLGGYNCKHVFAFRSLFSVPKTDIERNIENGNFKPTARELELLEL